MSIADQLPVYRSFLQRRKSSQTARMYLWVAEKFLEFLEKGGLAIDRLTQADIERFLSGFGVSSRSLTMYSYALSTFLRFVGKERLASLTPVTRYDAREPPWLPVEKVREIINAAEDPVERALLLLSYELALRVSEAVSLKWEDVDLRNRTVAVARAKKKKLEKVVKPISEEAAGLLAGLPRTSEYVFSVKGGRGTPGWHGMSVVQAMRIFRRAAERVGLKGYTFHTLRHSRATEIAERTGGNIVEIARVTDHSDPKSVMVYSHIALSRLREVMYGRGGKAGEG
jgi:integrase